MEPLPVDEYLSRIAQTVRKHAICAIEAPPGTGKTTRVAPSLRDLIQEGQKIYLVQPRRIAARSVAERIAQELNQRVGQQIGYAIRFEQKLSEQTQLVVVTEGILIRKLQQDPTLQDGDRCSGRISRAIHRRRFALGHASTRADRASGGSEDSDHVGDTR